MEFPSENFEDARIIAEEAMSVFKDLRYYKHREIKLGKDFYAVTFSYLYQPYQNYVDIIDIIIEYGSKYTVNSHLLDLQIECLEEDHKLVRKSKKEIKRNKNNWINGLDLLREKLN